MTAGLVNGFIKTENELKIPLKFSVMELAKWCH